MPKSVHKLTPGKWKFKFSCLLKFIYFSSKGDIDIVAAVGDSLTAGNGVWAVDALQVLIEGKGVSFTAGGQGTLETDA